MASTGRSTPLIDHTLDWLQRHTRRSRGAKYETTSEPPTGRQAGTQACRQTDRQTDRHTYRQRGRQTDGQTDRQSDRQTIIQTDRRTTQTDRQTDRQHTQTEIDIKQTDITQTDLQINIIQTDELSHKQTKKQTDTHTHSQTVGVNCLKHNRQMGNPGWSQKECETNVTTKNWSEETRLIVRSWQIANRTDI